MAEFGEDFDLDAFQAAYDFEDPTELNRGARGVRQAEPGALPPPNPDPATLRSVIGDILQPTHLLFVLVVALLVLGPKRLPEVGRSLGSGLRDFRAAINGMTGGQDDETPSEPSTEDSQPASSSPDQLG